MTAAAAPTLEAAAPRAGHYRWVICGLLFFAMVFNYVDRQMIGVLKPTLQHEFGWSETAYGNIVFYFQAAYAVSYLFFGRFVDWVGAKAGYAVAFVIWTIGHMSHAAVRTVSGFILARIVLGVGEGGGFPAGIKAVAEWFPRRERALATGIFNAGTNVGAIVTPLIVPLIALDMGLGWRMTFLITGLPALLGLAAWLIVYRRPAEHPRVRPAELALIESDPIEPPLGRISWVSLLRTRETWAYCAGKFLLDPIWWMFLFWLPDFFAKRYHLDLKTFGPPLVAVYLLSNVGSIAGGWFSGALIKRGFTLNAARKTAMLTCAVLVTPVAFAMYAGNLWLAVGIIGLATAAHQGFSANLYTLPSDVFPKAAVGTVSGIGGAAGAIGGMLMAEYAGWVLQKIGSYTPIFVVAASVYLLAVLIIHLLTPRYEPAKLS
ncbi:MAG TPA: MFS transporter [Caulobacteraceae bacterium]|jgi:ACS family hexuronate transporter-like MFS transporter